TDDLFKLCARHLSVPESNTNIRNEPANHFRHFFNILHTVMDEENLPSTRNFLQNGIPNQLLIKAVNFSINRLTVGRRSIDHTQISGAHERKLKRSWNGSCGKSEHINRGAEIFEFFFRTHAKSLFLIHNDEPEIFE